MDTEIDNPLLDVDDTERGGPENIFIHRAGDQFYDVYVDYYDGMTETLPEIEVWYGNDLIDMCIIPRTYRVLPKAALACSYDFCRGSGG